MAGVCVRNELRGSGGGFLCACQRCQKGPRALGSRLQELDRTACIPAVLQLVPLTKGQPLMQEAIGFQAVMWHNCCS